jgi:hypothetical protein
MLLLLSQPLAFSATSFPTAIATSTLVPFPISFSLEEAE